MLIRLAGDDVLALQCLGADAALLQCLVDFVALDSESSEGVSLCLQGEWKSNG